MRGYLPSVHRDWCEQTHTHNKKGIQHRILFFVLSASVPLPVCNPLPYNQESIISVLHFNGKYRVVPAALIKTWYIYIYIGSLDDDEDGIAHTLQKRRQNKKKSTLGRRGMYLRVIRSRKSRKRDIEKNRWWSKWRGLRVSMNECRHGGCFKHWLLCNNNMSSSLS